MFVMLLSSDPKNLRSIIYTIVRILEAVLIVLATDLSLSILSPSRGTSLISRKGNLPSRLAAFLFATGGIHFRLG
jgi:hypothetical protein